MKWVHPLYFESRCVMEDYSNKSLLTEAVNDKNIYFLSDILKYSQNINSFAILRLNTNSIEKSIISKSKLMILMILDYHIFNAKFLNPRIKFCKKKTNHNLIT